MTKQEWDTGKRWCILNSKGEIVQQSYSEDWYGLEALNEHNKRYGHPGYTQRELTKAEIQAENERILP